MSLRHALLSLFFSVSLSGCFLEIVVPTGGTVVSDSGDFNCGQSSTCRMDITAANVDDTFTAVPAPGFEFVRWIDGDDFICGDAATATCVFSNLLGAGNPAVELFLLSSFDTFYAMPVFREIPVDTDEDGTPDVIDDDDDNDGVLDDQDNCPLEGPNVDGFGCPGTPITDTVIAAGKEWAQPDLFTFVTWLEMNVACPGGTCSGALTANGVTYNLNGWQWASIAELNSLFNVYLNGAYTMAAFGPDSFSQVNSTWAPEWFASGFRPTTDAGVLRSTQGWSSTLPSGIPGSAPFISDLSASNSADTVSTGNITLPGNSTSFIGVWLVRSLTP